MEQRAGTERPEADVERLLDAAETEALAAAGGVAVNVRTGAAFGRRSIAREVLPGIVIAFNPPATQIAGKWFTPGDA